MSAADISKTQAFKIFSLAILIVESFRQGYAGPPSHYFGFLLHTLHKAKAPKFFIDKMRKLGRTHGLDEVLDEDLLGEATRQAIAILLGDESDGQFSMHEEAHQVGIWANISMEALGQFHPNHDSPYDATAKDLAKWVNTRYIAPRMQAVSEDMAFFTRSSILIWAAHMPIAAVSGVRTTGHTQALTEELSAPSAQLMHLTRSMNERADAQLVEQSHAHFNEAME